MVGAKNTALAAATVFFRKSRLLLRDWLSVFSIDKERFVLY
jgi:hypothetical protein